MWTESEFNELKLKLNLKSEFNEILNNIRQRGQTKLLIERYTEIHYIVFMHMFKYIKCNYSFYCN